jgi:hypothetical protein
MSMLNLEPSRWNALLGVAVFLAAALVAVFVGVLLGSTNGDAAIALGSVVGAIAGGGFVLGAAIIAWRSIQTQIEMQKEADNKKIQDTRESLEKSLLAELLVFPQPLLKRLLSGTKGPPNVSTKKLNVYLA